MRLTHKKANSYMNDWEWTLVEDSRGRWTLVDGYGNPVNWGMKFKTAVSHVIGLYNLQLSLD